MTDHIPVVDATQPFTYASGDVPPTYRCSGCGAFGCKLWREYQTFLDQQSLLCADCAGEAEGKDVSKIDSDGRRPTALSDNLRTDQIGWRIPAVPTEENNTYWGYTSVPDAGVYWWRQLPTRREKGDQ